MDTINDNRQSPDFAGQVNRMFDRVAAQFDLSLHVDTEFGHRLHIEYATDLFAPATAQRLLDNYLVLLEGLLQADDGQPISALDSIAPAERALVASWQGASVALPPRPLVHDHDVWK